MESAPTPSEREPIPVLMPRDMWEALIGLAEDGAVSDNRMGQPTTIEREALKVVKAGVRRVPSADL